MKRRFFLALLFTSVFLACADNPASGDAKPKEYEVSVSGTVTCNGTPVAGAVISDGIEVTQTDRDGNYTLLSPGRMGYVFISVPSGYKVDNKGVLPNHYLNVKGKKAEKVNFTLLPMPEKDYTIFVMTDMHLIGSSTDKDIEQFRATFLPDITREATSVQGEVFSFSLGDMTTDTRWYANNFALPEYLREFKNYPGPIYHIMGNHDNDPQATGTGETLDANAKAPYRKHIGPDYYSLNIGDVHYVMLDNIVSGGKYVYQYLINDTQLKWLEKDLSLVDKSTPVVVLMHVPAYVYNGISNGDIKIKKRTTDHQDVQVLIDLLKPFDEVHILTGHDHRNRNIQITKNILEHNLASASAISWKLNDVRIMTTDGTPSGYQIFKVDGKNIKWQYKAVGLDIDKSQFRVYDMNVVPAEYGGKPGANEFLINVFNWDPQWKVVVTENGQRLPVEQIWGKDPLYMLIRDKTRTFDHRPNDWRAVNCIHLFNARAASADSEIVVSVTDRFGNVYTETVARPKTFREEMN